ncbi:hypothetical protein [Desulfitibacter alkalitolerans]|uniref:hypothetical protein n=1 Tax=Desulfitibacter alkalitolerans TaxID=264641 RepID=UPI000482B35E|nr:hypothetical protein [Desulfitibacter alkalitolerans]
MRKVFVIVVFLFVLFLLGCAASTDVVNKNEKASESKEQKIEELHAEIKNLEQEIATVKASLNKLSSSIEGINDENKIGEPHRFYPWTIDDVFVVMPDGTEIKNIDGLGLPFNLLQSIEQGLRISDFRKNKDNEGSIPMKTGYISEV